MIRTESFELQIKKDDSIVGDVKYSTNFEGLLPVVIITHGFTGHKDWGFLPYFSEKLAQNGFLTITYNFSTDLVDPIRDWFIDVDKFSTFTISQEVNELAILVENICQKSIFSEDTASKVDTSTLYLVGQSLGGAVSMIFSAKFNKAEKIVLLGTVGTLFRYTERQVELWKKEGIWSFSNTRTGQPLKLSVSYYYDLIENNYKLENFLSNIRVPVLFIHGREDLTVPLKEIENLIQLSKNPFVELKVIEKTGHTFGVEHPFSHSTEPLELVIKETINFLRL
ncbi:MAG: alpha/beta hydrolase family protein [Candidatus Kapaibacteriota bacterium]